MNLRKSSGEHCKKQKRQRARRLLLMTMGASVLFAEITAVIAFSEMQIARDEAREKAEAALEYEVSKSMIQEIKTVKATVAEIATTTEEEPESVAVYPVPLDEELQVFIVNLCEEHHIDSAIVFAMIDHESDFDADATGDGGNSLGLMQIQPKWHKDRMQKLDCTDLLDPFQNVTVGIDYLAECLDKGKGVEWALMAYNGGASYANKMAKKGIISDYATEVLANSETLKEGIQMMFYTDDPIRDAERYQAAQDNLLQSLPVCADCDEHIQDETAYYINGEWICRRCMEAYERQVLPE